MQGSMKICSRGFLDLEKAEMCIGIYNEETCTVDGLGTKHEEN